ncbi:MAG: type IV pilus biogenesis/stability protein PilW [Gammaproteobacteria bacterium]|nr:type IV pilus biogenesis/stability protein PilW [Gammaproteobacteria bacterium]
MNKIIITIGMLVWLQFITGCASSGKKHETDFVKASQINVQLGAEYLARNKLNLAKDKLEKALEQNPDNALAHSTMALLLENVGQHEDVIEHYEEAMSLDPSNSDIKNNYGTYLCNQSRFDEAQKLFKMAINDPYYRTHTVALVNAGQCAMNNSRYDLAERYLRKALRKNPKLAKALYSMALLGIKSKKYLMTRAYIQRYHDVARHSAESLWVQIRAEKALGDTVHMSKLIQTLNIKFPDSNEAGLAMGLVR